LSIDASVFTGGTYEHASEKTRVIVACTDCDGPTMVSVERTRSRDGTEARFRSGETTLVKMAAICKQNHASCEMKAAEAGGAVGWLTTYKVGSRYGSTLVLFQNGDLLTVRALSDNRRIVTANMDAAVLSIVPQIVGP